LDPDGLSVAASWNELGVLYRRLGEVDRANSAYRRALALRERLLPASLEVALTLNNLGVLARAQGELHLAERYHRRALGIRETLAPGGFAVAESLNNLAVVALNRGDLGLAERSLRRTLEIRERLLPGSREVANSLNNLGGVAWSQGELELSRGYHERALTLRRELAPKSAATATSLNNLGSVARRMGQPEVADGYFSEALALRREIAPLSVETAKSQHAVGRGRLERGLPGARSALEAAQAIAEQSARGSLLSAEIDMSLGELALRESSPKSARSHFERALAARRRWAPDSEAEAESHHALARTSQLAGDDASVPHHFEAALASLDGQVNRLSRSRDVRAGFRARFGPLYRDAIGYYVDAGERERAFHTLERYRAREFLTLLSERELMFEADLPPELAARRQATDVRLRTAYRRLSEHAETDDENSVEKSRDRVRQLQKERELLTEELRSASPRLAQLKALAPVTLSEVQAHLEEGVALLSFSVGDERSFLFAVTQDDAVVHVIPISGEAIERRVATFRQLVRDYRSNSPIGAVHEEPLRGLARSLFDELVAPAEDLLERSTKVVILPDGPLHELPFAALRRAETSAIGSGDGSSGDERSSSGAREQFLVEWKPVERVASATLYVQNRSVPFKPAQCRKGLVGFGDPPRSDFAGLTELPPLPYARLELEGARAAIDKRPTEVYVGVAATESRVRMAAEDACILHFATHTSLDPKLPLNSSLILGREANGGDGEDGLLQVWEVFDQLRLDADLVVLSACESALGAELGGEGLRGIARAFGYAGARSVVGTLWSVTDRASADLVIEFYSAYAAGSTPAQALRQAQLHLIAIGERTDAAPYYWAGFTIFEGSAARLDDRGASAEARESGETGDWR